MKAREAAQKVAKMAMVPVLIAAVGVGYAQDQDKDHRQDDRNRNGQSQQDQHNQNQRPDANNRTPQDNHNGQYQGDHNGNHQDNRNGQYQDNRNGQYHDNRGGNYQGNGGGEFRFRDQDRNQFASHYQGDINRWRSRPQGRPQFARGQRIPDSYRFQPVPSGYYTNYPPPAGYQYGYYDGYVVAYNPTTRIIADVLDLVTAASYR